MDPFSHVSFVPIRSVMKRPSLSDRVRQLFKRKTSPEPETSRPDPGKYSPCDPISKANEYRKVLGSPSTIVVFRNGTCIFSDKRMTREQAADLMKTEGPVVSGTWKADYFVGKIREPIVGTVIRYHHPNIVSFVNESEYPLSCPEYAVGAFVRMARDCDSRDLHIVHYESV
jgi:hypothetical protein